MPQHLQPPPIPIIVDEIIHSDERPFCDDMKCPCHHGKGEYFYQYCLSPYQEGLITYDEARRIFYGEQVGGWVER